MLNWVFQKRSSAGSRGIGVFFLVVAAALNGAAQPGEAQEIGDTLAVPDSVARVSSPSGAFLRGVLIPGWGHTVSGSLTRGAFYFGVESMAGWMLFKTVRRLGTARRQADLWERRVTAQLMAQGVSDVEEVAAQLEEHEDVALARGLVSARKEQREDWMAVVIFTLLVSGLDAFVSAHLQDFPDPLTVEGDPTGGVLEVGIRIPAG